MWRRRPKTAVSALDGCMLSDPGLKRSTNEDRCAYMLPRNGHGCGVAGDFIAIVADGMGGHAAGEVASAMAIDVVYRTLLNGRGAPPALLIAGLKAANDDIYRHAQSHAGCGGMGTTCTAVVVRHGQAFLGHVGDSRLYLLRKERLHQLSEDHSLVSDLVRAGVISEEEGRARPDRNIILRAIGTKPKVDVATWKTGLPLLPGDALLLCSDGLTDGVGDDAIREILLDNGSPAEACRALVDAALAAGGEDNVTVGVFVAHGDPPRMEREGEPLRDTRVRAAVKTP